MSNFNGVSPWNGLRRCILNPDGSRVGYLDANDSNKWEDGTSVNWTTVESSGQNVMVEIPKFYYAKKVVGDERIFGVADVPTDTVKIPLADWKIHPAFYRDRVNFCDVTTGTATEVDYRYVGAFHGWVDGSNRLRSLPNKLPTASKTIGDFRTHARNMGVGWSQFDFYALYALQMLYITEYQHPDSQTMVGRGYADGNTSAINTGGTLNKGNNTFGETTGKVQMSYRGVEDLWGNVRNWVDGYFCDGSRNILIGNKGYNNTGSGYTNFGSGGTVNVLGNISDIQGVESTGFTIKATNSNSSYNNGLYDYGRLSAGSVPFCGASWANGSGGGLFYFFVYYSASNSDSDIASRLCF